MYHGWSDPALTPLVSVDFYTAVAQQIDGGSLSKLQNNARLFMVPGMHHCAGGPGPNVFDALTPLGEWVQFGIAPTQIIAAHYTDNNQSLPMDRTMPLCPYPQQAKYTHGPVDEASVGCAGTRDRDLAFCTTPACKLTQERKQLSSMSEGAVGWSRRRLRRYSHRSIRGMP